jgi:hypothetical protein
MTVIKNLEMTAGSEGIDVGCRIELQSGNNLMAILPEKGSIKQAYSLAYATFRLAETLSHEAFQQAFENRAVRLLLASLDEDAAIQTGILRDIEHLVGFGRDVGAIHPQTAELMLQEIGRFDQLTASKFNPAIRKNNNAAIGNPVKKAVSIPKEVLFPKKEAKTDIVPVVIDMPAKIIKGGRANERENAPEQLAEKFDARKAKILEIIRQSGNPPAERAGLPGLQLGCRLRDVQEVLPEVSERTLRYDIQRLGAEGLIERIGNGGPSTYYRVKSL